MSAPENSDVANISIDYTIRQSERQSLIPAPDNNLSLNRANHSRKKKNIPVYPTATEPQLRAIKDASMTDTQPLPATVSIIHTDDHMTW